MTKALDRLEALIKGLAGVCLGLVFILVTAQVASRFIFNFSFATASELSIFAMIWSVFLGAAVAFRHNQHIAMDFVRNLAPDRIGRLIDGMVFACLVVFLGVIILNGYDLSLRAMRQLSTAAGLPVGYVSMAMPICSALALVFLIEGFLRRFRKAAPDD